MFLATLESTGKAYRVTITLSVTKAGSVFEKYSSKAAVELAGFGRRCLAGSQEADMHPLVHDPAEDSGMSLLFSKNVSMNPRGEQSGGGLQYASQAMNASQSCPESCPGRNFLQLEANN